MMSGLQNKFILVLPNILITLAGRGQWTVIFFIHTLYFIPWLKNFFRIFIGGF